MLCFTSRGRFVWILSLCALSYGAPFTVRTFADDAGAPPLVIARQGDSGYQLVIPDAFENPATGKLVVKAAEFMRRCLEEGAGVELPLVAESQAVAGTPCIYLGATRFAQAHGLAPAQLSGWTYIHKAVGRDLILAGRDAPGVAGGSSPSYKHHTLGTVKAITAFLETYAGVRFLLPGENGLHIPLREKIEAPGALDATYHPQLEFNTTHASEMMYDIAGNHFPSAAIKLYGGHSYYDAVPAKRYAAEHPEYFIEIEGVRDSRGNHLCISNPDVQELLFQEMLAWLDKGYDAVELAQTDGCRPCECAQCKALYGVGEYGEKLWILHKNLAERMHRERPGKTVILLNYGPTRIPPRTFTEFPDNVMIELCSYGEDELAQWKRYQVPRGFMVYVYNWGYYHSVGLTPKRTPDFCRAQADLFLANHVRGIYKCGFGELFGLEGPVYYVYGRMFDSAQRPAWQVAEEFYQAAYGPAAPPMRAFFSMLYDRLELNARLFHLKPGGLDFETETGRMQNYLPRNPRLILALLYSPDLLDSLGKNLATAEKLAATPKEKQRIALVRMEFDYLANLAAIIHLYNAYRVAPDMAAFDRLAAALETRNRMIARFCPDANVERLPEWPEVRFLGGISKDMLKVNGRLHAPISAPLTWNIAALRAMNILPGTIAKRYEAHRALSPVSTTDGPDAAAWKDIPAARLGGIQLGEPRQNSEFKIIYDNEALYFMCDAGVPPEEMKYNAIGRDGAAHGQECFEFFLDPFARREKYYHLIVNPVPDSCYDAAYGLIDDPLDPGYGKSDPSWNGEWTYRAAMDLQAGRWHVCVRVPFKTLGVPAPVPGDIWLMNIGRAHYYEDGRPKKSVEYSLWSPNLETVSFHDKDAFGELLFGE